MKSNLAIAMFRRVWFYAFLAGCAVFLFLNSEELLASSEIPSIRNPGFLALALALQAATWVALANGWQQVLYSRLGNEPRLLSALHHLALLSLGKYLPGKVWGLLARGSKMADQGITTDAALDTTALEQVVVLHSAAIVSAVFCFSLFPAWISAGLVAAAMASMVFGHSLAGLALSALARVTTRFRGTSGQPPEVRISRRAYAALTLRYCMAWLLHGLAFASIYLALTPTPLSTSPATIALLIFANTSGMVAGFVAVFAPAGLGVREAAMVGVLASQLGMSAAIVLSIAMRLWTLATDALFAGIALLASALCIQSSRR